MKRNDYQKLFNELLKLNKGAKKDFTLQQFEKAIGGTLPKSYFNKSYLKQRSPVGKFCKENNIEVKLNEPIFIFEKK